MRQRPVYLNLFQITLPPGGWVSIMHRVTGVFLILATPFFLYFLGRSLHDDQGFQHVAAVLGSLPVRFLVWAAAVALLHHMLAGIRHLLLDMKIGIGKACSRLSAYAVMALDVAGVLLLGMALWP